MFPTNQGPQHVEHALVFTSHTYHWLEGLNTQHHNGVTHSTPDIVTHGKNSRSRNRALQCTVHIVADLKQQTADPQSCNISIRTHTIAVLSEQTQLVLTQLQLTTVFTGQPMTKASLSMCLERFCWTNAFHIWPYVHLDWVAQQWILSQSTRSYDNKDNFLLHRWHQSCQSPRCSPRRDERPSFAHSPWRWTLCHACRRYSRVMPPPATVNQEHHYLWHTASW